MFNRSARTGSVSMTPRPRGGKLSLGVESLETRLNLSGLAGAIAPPITINTHVMPAPTMSGPFALQSREVGSLSAGAGVESLNFGAATPVSGSTTVPISSYSAISNSKLELQAGAASPNIGWISTNGAFVEYTVTADAGTYRLDVDLASFTGANVKVEVNGAFNGEIRADATGGWAAYKTSSANVQLASGTNTLRFTALNWSQYNIGALALTAVAPQKNVMAVGDSVALNVTAYSDIGNAKLEYQSNQPDIGYNSPNGSYVDYTVNVATAGNYTLTADAGSWNAASFDVYASGAKLASFNTSPSFSWQAHTALAQTVSLNAGVQTLRFSTTNGSQYNLFAVNLQRQTAQSSTQTPTPVPAAPASSYTSTLPEVSVSQRWMTSFTELDIVGTSSGDSIYVAQSGSTLIISANGRSQQVNGAIGELVIWGQDGNDTITVDSSVTLDARIYGGAGSDTITDKTQGKATIISFGGGKDSVVGNGVNTSYWVDTTDVVGASTGEIAGGRVHAIAAFYQPYTTSKVTNEIDGANLADPASDGAGWMRTTNSSFFGTGPRQEDINQGQVGDCYFLTTLQSLARLTPDRLREMAVDLGDGTFAVQFKRNGVTDFVRVDADLPTSPWGGLYYNRPGVSGSQWASIMEKAYAFYRYGYNSYGSLESGWMTTVYGDLGVSAYTYGLPLDQNAFYTVANAALSANKAVDIGTLGVIANGAPLVAKHTYSVTALTKDSSGTVWVTLRNPWGMDGFNVDSNQWDGILTLSYSTLKANVSSGSIWT